MANNYQIPQPPLNEEEIINTLNQICNFLRVLNDRISKLEDIVL